MQPGQRFVGSMAITPFKKKLLSDFKLNVALFIFYACTLLNI